MAKGDADSADAGAWIILGGLILQIIFFALFVTVTVAFDLAMRKRPTPRSQEPGVNWRKQLGVLYATSTAIMVRNLVRVVEYAQGNSGWLLSHEWPLYVFDAVMMLSVMVVLNVWHPSSIKALAGEGRFLRKGFKLQVLPAKTSAV